MRPNLSTGSGLLAILLWSTTFALARSISEQTGPITAGAGVYLVGGCLCLARLFWSGQLLARLREVSRKYLLGCGLLFCFYTSAIYLAVGLAKDREQLLEIALVNYLWPSLTIVFSIPILGKRAGVWLWPGTLFGFSGIFLVMTQDTRVSWASLLAHVQDNPVPYALAFAAAVSWALYSNLTRRWSGPGTRGAVEWFIPTTGLVLLLLRACVNETAVWNVQPFLEVLTLGVLTAVAYGLWDLAMRRGNLVLVAVCSYFTPLLSTFVSCLYLGVAPNGRLWIGCLLLISGSLLTWRSVHEPSPS